jgi:adenylate cyclase
MGRFLKAAAFACFIGILGLGASFFHFSHHLEEDIELGLLFQLRGPTRAPSDVVVVSIDRESSEHLKVSHNPDRWPRSLYAELVDKLRGAGARIIVFDVYFIEPRSNEEDSALARAIGKARDVVLAEPLRVREIAASLSGDDGARDHRIVQSVKPIAPIAQSAFASAPFVLPRIPVRVSQYWTFQPEAGDSPTFPIVAFQSYAIPVFDDFIGLLRKVRPERAGNLPVDSGSFDSEPGAVASIRTIRQVFEGDESIVWDMTAELERSKLLEGDPIKRSLLLALIHMYGGAPRRYLNYYGPPRTLATLPFHRALTLEQNTVDEKPMDLKGKVVFVGLSEILLAEKQDSFHTVFSKANGVFVSGVEIAATAFANLLENKPIRPIGTLPYLLIILAWGIVIGVICRMTATMVGALAVVGLSIFYLFTAGYQFKADGAWFPIVIPLFVQAPLGFFGAVLLNYFETNRERQNIRNALSYYVPTEVVSQMARNRVDMRRGGETVYGVCLFADAAGYTSFSERFEPRDLRDIMHRYFEATFAPIHKTGGLVVDLKGDSVLAIWKSARPEAALRQQACMAALDLAKAVQEFNRRLDSLQLPTRIGLHAGEIFLGNIGAGEHYEYGVTGDTVNTASRMDGLNKYLGTQILVSAEVMQGLNGFLTREAGTFLLKGKTQPVVVHELLCRLEEAEEKQILACAVFADAQQAFRQRAWGEAKTNFRRCIDLLGEDSLSRFYLELCEEHLKDPPGSSWTGVVEMTEK